MSSQQNSLPNSDGINLNGNSNSINQSQQQVSNPTPPSIYSIYNRMTLLLKTLMTTAHIVPAFRLASKVNQPNVICYRVYTIASASSCQNLSATGQTLPSKHDIMFNNNTNRSVELLSKGDGLNEDVDQHFGPLMKLGSIKTETNELSVCYRTDVSSSNHLEGPRRYDRNRTGLSNGRFGIQDEDYLMAAKQLLSGYSNNVSQNNRRASTENLDCFDQPLMPAFASRVAPGSPRTTTVDEANENECESVNDTCELLESAFEGLLNHKATERNQDKITAPVGVETTSSSTRHGNGSERSANIQVPAPRNISPRGRRGSKSQPNSGNNQASAGSTPKSLSDSFVFVDINPPFASEEQNDINSFFHGPSPSFSNGFDSLKDVDEVTNQLATIEASAKQIDVFVDNICSYEDEEEEER